jgi:hypothetical protein
MAVKKKETSKTSAASAAPKAAKKAVTEKAASSAKSATGKLPVASGTSTKVGTPKAAMPAKAAARKSASKEKEAAPIRLTDRQRDFLKTISATKEGYTTAKKAEQKTIEALLDRKLIKRGAKDKQSGNYCYLVSKAGEKHLT